LKWNEQTEEEHKAQITGFSITSGNKGYLRASIGMIKENYLLRLVFPKEFWEHQEKSLSYDFIKNYPKMLRLGWAYLVSVVLNKEIVISEEQKKQTKMGDMIIKMLNSQGWKNMGIVSHTESDFPFAVCWLNSLIEFFELGIQKQKEKLNPRVEISW